jgi:hypothetical protein
LPSNPKLRPLSIQTRHGRRRSSFAKYGKEVKIEKIEYRLY